MGKSKELSTALSDTIGGYHERGRGLGDIDKPSNVPGSTIQAAIAKFLQADMTISVPIRGRQKETNPNSGCLNS